MPRFVVLWHQLPTGHARATHWDFMLEENGALQTWALKHSPRRGMSIEAIQLPNHRLDYLDYQGPVSGDRGHVTRFDEGTFTWRPHPSALEVWLNGRQLCGACRLTSTGDAWTWEMP